VEIKYQLDATEVFIADLCCIYLAFYFHILTTMHDQNHIKFNYKDLVLV